MTSEHNNMVEDVLRQVVSKLKISIKRIEEQFLPELKSISTPDESHDFKTVVRETIKDDFDIIMKLIDGENEDVIETVIENNNSEETTVQDVSPAAVKDVATPTIIAVDKAISGNDYIDKNDIEDDDKTVFEGITCGEDLKGDREITSNKINENTDNENNDQQLQQGTSNNLDDVCDSEQQETRNNVDSNVSSDVGVPVGNMIEVYPDIHAAQSQANSSFTQNSGQEFQDTPSSVPDFRVYNTNKDTYAPFVSYQPNSGQSRPPWKEKVDSFLDNLVVGSLPSDGEANSILEMDDMSVISSVSQKRHRLTSMEKNNNNEEDKENTPVDNLEREEVNGSLTIARKNIADNSDTDQIVLHENQRTEPISAPNSLDESEIFRVDTDGDATMTCVSESLLKNEIPTEHSSIAEVKHSTLIEQIPKQYGGLEIVDLTLDSDNENDDSCSNENVIEKSENHEDDSYNSVLEQIPTPAVETQSESVNEIINKCAIDDIDAKDVNDINIILDSDDESETLEQIREDTLMKTKGKQTNSESVAKDPNNESMNVRCNDVVDPEHILEESVNNGLHETSEQTIRDGQNEESLDTAMTCEINHDNSKEKGTVNNEQLSEYKVESLHIIDDYTLGSNSQPLDNEDYDQCSSQEEKYPILSQGGNFNDEPVEPYEVIPSVKVEVVMTEGNEEITYDTSTPATNIKSNEGFKTPLPPKQKSLNKINVGRVEKEKLRKKCELGITSAFPLLDNKKNKEKHIVLKRPGPKSRTKLKGNKAKISRDALSNAISKLTNLNNLENPQPSSGAKTKKKRQRKPTLVDFLEESSNSQNSDTVLNPKLLMSFKNTDNIAAENLAREGILRSDFDDEENFIPPVKQSRLDKDETKENIVLPKHPRKEIPSWKKDPILIGSLNLPSQNSCKKPKSIKSKSNAQDDDVRSVCSSIQETIRDPIVRENLKKLFDTRETVVREISVIDLSGSDEEQDDDAAISDDDAISVISYQTKDLLNTELKAKAKERKKRVSSLLKRAQKMLPSSSQESTSSNETFEDRYKDTPPLVLYINDRTEKMVSVCPFYSKILKEHQKRGVQFMWDVCFGPKEEDDSESLISKEGSGCILAHDMGLGKSLQVIALLHTLKRIENIPLTKILILAPKSVVQNWEDEIVKWTKGLQVKLNVFSWTTDKNIAVQDLHEWLDKGGVYILGYEMFVSVCKKFSSPGSVDFTKFFLDPGPDVVICDEAHQLKNNHSEKHKMVSRIQTKRRIALTGTPIQNNLQELYNIVHLVQPTFMRPEKFRDQFIEPISRGQNLNASKYEKSKATERISVLHKELVKVMDREEGNNQEVGLPPKMNYDIFLELTPIQKKMYKFFFDQLKDIYDQKRNFEVERKAQLIGIHPKSLDTPKGSAQLRKTNENPEKNYEWPAALHDNWWNNILTESEKGELNKIEAGVKIKVAFKILKYAAKEKEKVLIFCNCHEVLNLMETYLKENDYEKNKNYFRLDGTVASHQRRKYLNIFNDEKNTDAQVFLLTHKVGGVGLNFTGANRIIILDMPWNPSHHEQSSKRTHRLGQKKTSFIYRLIPKDTMEEKIYKDTVSKQSLAKQVVDKKKIKSQHRETGIYNFVYKESIRSKKELPLSKDDLLNSFLKDKELNVVCSYREQGELFELSEEQLNEAQAYEEYIQESRSLDVPGELKRKRKSKKSKEVALENESSTPDLMLSKQHIERFNHSELLMRMHHQGQTPHSSTHQTQNEPMNLSRSQEFRMPPPPLVPIPRKGNKWKCSPSMNSVTGNTNPIPPQKPKNQSNELIQKEVLKTSVSQTEINNNQALKAGYNSLSEFINNTRQELRPAAHDNINPNVDVFQQLAINKEVDIIQRPRLENSNTNKVEKTFAHNNGADQQRRLTINPNIFQTEPSEANQPVQSKRNKPYNILRPEHGEGYSQESQRQLQNTSRLPQQTSQIFHNNRQRQSHHPANAIPKHQLKQRQGVSKLPHFKTVRRGRPPGKLNSKPRAGLVHSQQPVINQDVIQNGGYGMSCNASHENLVIPNSIQKRASIDQNVDNINSPRSTGFQQAPSSDREILTSNMITSTQVQRRPSSDLEIIPSNATRSFEVQQLPLNDQGVRIYGRPRSIEMGQRRPSDQVNMAPSTRSCIAESEQRPHSAPPPSVNRSTAQSGRPSVRRLQQPRPKTKKHRAIIHLNNNQNSRVEITSDNVDGLLERVTPDQVNIALKQVLLNMLRQYSNKD